MIYPIAAIVILGVLLMRSGLLPAKPSRALFEKTASIGAVLAALLVLVRGNTWLSLIFFGIALWLLGRASRNADKNATPNDAEVSRLRSATIEMDYDRTTGRMTGSVIAGALEGQPLESLSRQVCDDLYRASLADDPEGARLLQAYFDRRFPGWRRVEDRDADARPQRPRRPGGMSEDEAYEVLGLRRGATRDDVVRTHRRVMKKWHPDQGGTADLAARANEAKEVLLRRHG